MDGGTRKVAAARRSKEAIIIVSTCDFEELPWDSCCGGKLRIPKDLLRTRKVESPSNARVPVNISYSTAPVEKISERVSTGLISAGSGHIYEVMPKQRRWRFWARPSGCYRRQ